MTTAATTDSAYWSHGIVEALEATMSNHRAVGEDFPQSRAALLANLKVIQAALPAAIAEVETAMKGEM